MALKDLEPFSRRDLFGGHGEVRIWNLMGQQAAAPFTAVLWCALEAGGRVGSHHQQDDPEVVICLGGSGRATVDNQGYPLAEGTLVYLPLGSFVTIENQSADEPLRYLIVKAAAHRA